MLAIDEEYAPAWLFQGSWLLKTERPDDALIAFERATNLEPGPSADFGRAQALIAAGRHAEAIEILEPLSKKSMHPQVHRTLGEALRSVGRTQEARRALAKGQDAAPLTWPDTRLKERDAHIRGHASYQLAQRLSASGKVDDALKILERLQGYHPPEKCGQEEEFFLACNLMNSLTIAYDRTGRPSRALETDIDWVVYAKRPFAGPAAVLEYLSRYTHRVAISNARLISHDTHGVTFKYKDADGVYSGLRAEHTKLCALVVLGVNERGEKRFLAMEDGVRESTQSWREILLKLKSRGMNVPELAIGDGAMGFWSALEEVYPETREQRCWMHKTMNVLNCLPKSSQAKAKQALHGIWQAETKEDAEEAFDLFLETYEPKYPKATICLQKDREELMAFYDFPAQHWQSLRTSNPIESTFGTIRHRTKRSKGCLTRDGMLHMMFKLGQCAEKNWRRLRGFEYLSKVITGVKFKDGMEVTQVDQVAA